MTVDANEPVDEESRRVAPLRPGRRSSHVDPRGLALVKLQRPHRAGPFWASGRYTPSPPRRREVPALSPRPHDSLAGDPGFQGDDFLPGIPCEESDGRDHQQREQQAQCDPPPAKLGKAAPGESAQINNGRILCKDAVRANPRFPINTISSKR